MPFFARNFIHGNIENCALTESALKKILIIDDDNVSQKAIARALTAAYDVETADDGDSGIAKAQSWHPQLILLDVEMPGKNGYEVCDLLKRGEQTKGIPIIFISAHNSLRERMLGYEVGAEDYLEKPCDDEILQTKVQRLLEAKHEKDLLNYQIKRAKETALEAIMGSSELGKAVRFVEATYSISNYDELAHRLFEFVDDLGLKTCLMFTTTEGEKFYSQTKSDVSPLEQDLMRMLHSDARFYDFGSRTQINYVNVSMLVKNMPLSDREKYGRMKDLLPFVLGAADEKVRILDTEYALRTQSSNLSRSVLAVKATLAEITSSMQHNQDGITQSVRGLLERLEHNLPNMGLEDDQESFIINLVDTAFSSAIGHVDSNIALKASLDSVVRLLQFLTDEQNQIVEAAVNHSNLRKGNEMEFNDIELF